MTCLVSHTTIDCHDAYSLSQWWKGVLGYVDVEGEPNEPGHEECMILDPVSGHRLLFIEVADPELPAKRIHLDLVPREGTRDAEVERLLGHGASLVADLRETHGPGYWAILADPEGNQLCVLRSESERAASER